MYYDFLWRKMMIYAMDEVEILMVMWDCYVTLNLVTSSMSSFINWLMSALIFHLKVLW